VGHAAPTSSASAASLVDAELSVYLQADVISRAESPTEWWAAKYPLLAAEAKRYLSAPPTSVASEHVFSAAGRIYTDKRLLPKRWKKIEQRSRKKSRFRFLAKIEIFDFEFGNRPSLVTLVMSFRNGRNWCCSSSLGIRTPAFYFRGHCGQTIISGLII